MSTDKLISVVMICFTIFTLSYITRADADITRGCKAMYVVNSAWFAPFSARASCSRLYPNKCRERAFDKIEKCVSVHWDERWDRVKPTHCTPHEGVYGYDIIDIKSTLEIVACCSQSQNREYYRDHVTANVEVVAFGEEGRGCDGGRAQFLTPSFRESRIVTVKTLTRGTYRVDCNEVRRTKGSCEEIGKPPGLMGEWLR